MRFCGAFGLRTAGFLRPISAVVIGVCYPWPLGGFQVRGAICTIAIANEVVVNHAHVPPLRSKQVPGDPSVARRQVTIVSRLNSGRRTKSLLGNLASLRWSGVAGFDGLMPTHLLAPWPAQTASALSPAPDLRAPIRSRGRPPWAACEALRNHLHRRAVRRGAGHGEFPACQTWFLLQHLLESQPCVMINDKLVLFRGVIDAFEHVDTSVAGRVPEFRAAPCSAHCGPGHGSS